MEAKKRLAHAVTAQYHGEAAAQAAGAAFVREVQKREHPENIEEKEVPTHHQDTPIRTVLVQAGLLASGSEARRMIQQGAVEVDRRRISDVNETLPAGKEYTIQVGKRRFVKIRLRLKDGQKRKT